MLYVWAPIDRELWKAYIKMNIGFNTKPVVQIIKKKENAL